MVNGGSYQFDAEDAGILHGNRGIEVVAIDGRIQ